MELWLDQKFEGRYHSNQVQISPLDDEILNVGAGTALNGRIAMRQAGDLSRVGE